MTILLTGFNRFGTLDCNPSQLIVEHIAEGTSANGDGLVTEVLPTEFAAAGERIRELIHSLHPEAVVCLGVAAARSTIGLERVALNIDDAELPDNAGDLAAGRLIVPGGPAAYWSTLPLPAMRDALAARGFPVAISNHAGTFVCNHVFYVARHELAQSNTPCGLIHVPLMAEQRESATGSTGRLPLADLIAAVDCCLEVIPR